MHRCRERIDDEFRGRIRLPRSRRTEPQNRALRGILLRGNAHDPRDRKRSGLMFEGKRNLPQQLRDLVDAKMRGRKIRIPLDGSLIRHKRIGQPLQSRERIAARMPKFGCGRIDVKRPIEYRERPGVIALLLKRDPKVRQERGIFAEREPGTKLGDGLIEPTDRAQSDPERIANLGVDLPGLDATRQAHDRLAKLPRTHRSNSPTLLLRLVNRFHQVVIGTSDADPAWCPPRDSASASLIVLEQSPVFDRVNNRNFREAADSVVGRCCFCTRA
jgi:plasmid stabilization system protein ParE